MNLYKKYRFCYSEKESFAKIKYVLSKNGIKSLDNFMSFINKYDDSMNYDTIYSYYTGKRNMPIHVISMIHNAFNESIQELVLPNSSCLFDGLKNDESLVYSEFNDYRNYYFNFGIYNNICTLYEQKYNKTLNFNELASENVEKLIINDITLFEKKLSRLIYLLQKANQSNLSNYEKREIDSGMYYIYSYKIDDDFLDRIKEYSNKELFYSLYNDYPLSFLKTDNFDFLTLFFCGNQNIVNRMTFFLTPIERNVLLTLIYNLKDINSNILKNTLVNDGATKLKSIADDEVIDNFNIDSLEELMNRIIRVKDKIKNLSYSEYEELREACNE